MDCKFRQIAENLYECEVCHFQYKNGDVHRNCGPSGVKKVVNFSKAITTHVLSGSKRATQEEIDARLLICKDCPLFHNDVCNHNDCGCNVNNKNKFLNKLAWKDQKCPLSKW